MAVDMKLLRQQLNNTCIQALEKAAGICIARTHYEITVEHFLAPLLDVGNSDVLCIADFFKMDVSKLRGAINRCLDEVKTGNSGRPQFSPFLADWLSDGWQVASLELGQQRIRSGALILALLRNSTRAYFTDYTDELKKVVEGDLKSKFKDVVGASIENQAAPGAGAGPGGMPAAAGGSPEALTQFTWDVTAKAKSGKIDAVIGREREVRQVVDILMRRYQNNPLIVGEPGTGKTAIVEGFALRIVANDVPASLQNITLLALDVGLLSAGASVKGEFERRLKQIIQEVNASNAAGKPIILFIDEAHTLIGGGGAGNDAANLLKPALARGELRTIAATTWAEYKKYIEKDPPFAQRFGLIKVEEPSVDVCVEMLRGTKDKYENHHKVRILDDAIRTAVAMSNQYLTEQQLPRKAVSLLDTACARVAVGMATTPGSLEDIRRRIIQIDTAIRALEREAASGHKQDPEKLDDLKKERERQQKASDELEATWKQEQELAQGVRMLRDELEAAMHGDAPAAPEGEAAKLRRPMEEIRKDLDGATKTLDGFIGRRPPLVPLQVDGDIVATILSDWTGIPAGSMVKDQAAAMLTFEDRIGQRVVGQDHAIREIGKRLRIASAKLQDPVLPLAVLFLLGPSGTGKTETALAIADLVFGGDRFMTGINMTEYSSSMNVSRLIGSAPGLVGFGEGGVLTEAVRKRPYSVVLLDEMEKAHMDVNLLFMQVFDKGALTDSEGRVANFKNTVIVMTSNEGSDMIMEMCADGETPTLEEMRVAIQPIIEKRFTPAFVGRTTVIPFYPLSPDVLRKIVDLKMKKIKQRLQSLYRMELVIKPEVGDTIAARCKTITVGARLINIIISETVQPEIARRVLETMGGDEKYSQLVLGVDPASNEFTYEFVK
ncbi:Chaperone protein ClpB [Phycisphaerae bacterium RAS1]|nr:Chaperone protein ClpB [Phycisphaerae bacterium RAS1]